MQRTKPYYFSHIYVKKSRIKQSALPPFPSSQYIFSNKNLTENFLITKKKTAAISATAF